MLPRIKSHHLGSIVAASLGMAAFVGASLAGAADSDGTVSGSAIGCGGGPPPAAPSRVAVLALTNWTLGTGQPGATLPSFSYGNRPLTPLMGDWNGDGLETVGTFEAGTFRLNDQNDSSGADHTFVFGDPRGYAVAGDFDGNRCDDVAVYRNGTWQVHYLGPGAPADTTFAFGSGSWPNTVPVAGDWNGDGVDGIGTYDRATATWVLKNTVGAGAPVFAQFDFGVGGSSYPVVGDWDGTGTDSPGYRTETTWTVRTTGVTSGSTATFNFGPVNAIPLTWSSPPTGSADLALDLEGVQNSCCGLQEITYGMVIENQGPSDADAPNTVTVEATLPESVIFDRFLPGSVSSCSYTPSTRKVTCTTQTLDASEGVIFRFVGVAGVGSHTVTATTFSDLVLDPDPTNNSDSVTNTIVAPPE